MVSTMTSHVRKRERERERERKRVRKVEAIKSVEDILKFILMSSQLKIFSN